MVEHTTSRVLEEVVKGLVFKKTNTSLVVLPSLFAFPSMLSLFLVLSIYYSTLLGSFNISEAHLLAYYVVLSFAFSAGFTLSTIASSYVLLRDLREHLYRSGLATYYFKGGQDYLGLLQYLENTIERTTLPTPTTGLVLALLTGGYAYPVILCIAEMSLRKHRRLEEKTLFNHEYTGEYRSVHAILDLVLFFATLGLYLIYMTYRTAKTFNKHVEEVHGSHPNPPTTPPLKPPAGSVEPTPLMVIGLCLLVLGVAIALSHLGIMANIYVYTSIGLLLGLTPITMRERRFTVIVLTVFTLLYLIIIGGVFGGIAGYSIYEYMLRYLEESRQAFTGDLLTISFRIFLNNYAISIPALVPFIGSLTLALGVFNAGLIVGTLLAHGYRDVSALVVLVLPHAILEILAYSIIISASALYNKPRKLVAVFVTGVLVLLIAALVEALTMMLLR